MKKYLIILILLVAKLSFSQNQANFWYFGHHKGLDFNDGSAVVLVNGQTYSQFGCATISDSIGNLLFYTAGQVVLNKNHLPLLNGLDLINPGIYGRTIVKTPRQDLKYYVFTARHPQMYLGLYYSVVDMSLNGGLGAVTEKDVPVESGWDAADRIAIVRHDNSDDTWMITRKYTEDAIASYLIDENGFHSEPVLSVMPDRQPNIMLWGFLKISYDKKYIISSYSAKEDLEVCGFNVSNGEANYMYTLEKPGNIEGTLFGIEFSPDSKFLYVSIGIKPDTTGIYQFDMQYISNQIDFSNSVNLVGLGHAEALQLARDGKIYCISEISDNKLSVINNPWLNGAGCDFQNDIIELNDGYAGYSFPNILLDYLLRFEWTGEPCQGYPIKFVPNFIPTPDSIIWNFDEFTPGSISTELSPTYSFQNPGVHEVKVDVWYPSGRYEHTSREIEIMPSPQPDLGPDTLICNGETLILNANCVADFFYWSNGQFGVSSITVSDSGTYWVKGRFSDSGCEGYDSIHVGFHPPTIIDGTNLEITPTTCNGASGSIAGLAAIGMSPFFYRWEDLSEVYFGSGIDVFSLPAGQYRLKITDDNGCETVSDVYTIEDAGNLEVLNVELTQPHCGRPDGQIVVHAFSPSGSALQYSVGDGVTYQADSVFSGLIGASYVVRVTDGNGCEGFYSENPVILEDIPGPQVTQVNVTDETDFLGNGAIEIVAGGSTPVIYYSIDGGNTYQSNNGTFNNVVCGMYYVVIKDENGCDTSFTVEVQNVILTILEAITGPGGHCLGEVVTVPVEVENFNSVASFQLKLNFNTDNLQCEGYINAIPQLEDNLIVSVGQANGEIIIQWQDTVAQTFIQNVTLLDLIFNSSQPGFGDLTFSTSTADSYFTHLDGSIVPAGFHTGVVKIYKPPEIILATSKTVCEGQMLSLMGIATGNQPPMTYRWIYPSGDSTSTDPFIFSITQADAGNYTLLATDAMYCTDQKTIHIEVSNNPVADFHGIDTLQMHPGDMLDAGAGMESYNWNTDDTTQSIVVQVDGMYSVGMESLYGCLGTDSIYVKLISDEIPSNYIFIPNAFSPDGDGLNDTFMAIATSDYIQKFHMLIFDRWGGQIFESNDILLGWDGTMHGKLLPGGMYTYKITYSIYPSLGDYSEQVRLGTVMMVR